ncbi:MAG: amidohydrolase [Succinivibrio sp.]
MTTEIKNFIEQEFYHFHSHPELSYQEFETTERIKHDLASHGIEVLPLNLETGAVGRIGNGDKKVALRADIDALPVTEETSLPYKSLKNGVMHACGHDSHAAIILGAALLLKEQEQDLKGEVRVIFQPAEEAPGGASKIIKAGALDKVDAIFGVHSAPIFEVGTLGIAAGPTCAAVEKFKITFKGKGTHAAHPNLGTDALYVAAAFVNAAQSIVSRNTDPSDPAVVSITHLDAGTTWNVIPETALLEGTIRTYSVSARKTAKDRLTELVHGIAASFGATGNIEWLIELPATNNDPKLSEFAKEIAHNNGFKVEKSPMSLGGEDFSLYQEVIKGAFIQVGTGESYPNHNPKFKIDPVAIYPAAKYVAELAKAYLERG